MKYVTFNNGIKMPILGLGVYQIWDLQQCEDVVATALKNGYVSIDTAEIYRNEEAVGCGIKKSGVNRSEIFITTKVWPATDSYHYYEHVIESVHASLEKLQTDYLDLVLLHNSCGDYHSAWKALEYLHGKGLIKSIGVSNFMPDKLVDLCLTARIKPALNQIEINPFYQRWEDNKWADKYGVVLESWASFGEGDPELLNNDVLKAIATKHNKSVHQVILRWLVQREIVVIPKTVHEDRLLQNIDVFDFELSDAEMQDIKNLDKNKPIFFDMSNPDTVEKLTGFKKWLDSQKK